MSHESRFIFLKTSKTASTSVEIGMSRFCGPDDILTPLTPDDERMRKDFSGRGAQNYLAPWWDYRPRDIGRLLIRREAKKRFHSHIQAVDVRDAVGDEIWNTYFTFCFVRNPWDRVVSHYYWRTKDPRPPLREFIERTIGILENQGWDVYAVDDEVAVDRVYRFENIEEGLRNVRAQLGLPAHIDIPHAKGAYRPRTASYREIMSDEDRELVASIYQKEIEMFGYRF